MIKKSFKTFFKSEIAIGVSLLIATAIAMIVANSEGYQTYRNFFLINLPLSLDFIGIHKDLTFLDWVNDALMAVFFLLVGLELKREILVGELSSRSKIILPIIAAFGGVIFPLLIFSFFNFDNPENMRGFAVPTATDIAFAYGMISLFGKKISNSLKVFLVALAVLDDLVAILFIAFFYSQNVNFGYLILATIVLFGLALLNIKNSRNISLYLVLGVFLWLMVLKSGIHATLSGVLLALFIPLKIKNESLLSSLAHKIAPVVNFLILPIFAFANSGVRIEKFSAEIFSQPLVLGIVCGLFFGKQIGVMLFSFIAIKLKIAHLPRGTDWFEFYGAAILTGIGFTMSLFIGSLAFFGKDFVLDEVKIAILLGSFCSAIFGIFVIYLSTRRRFDRGY